MQITEADSLRNMLGDWLTDWVFTTGLWEIHISHVHTEVSESTVEAGDTRGTTEANPNCDPNPSLSYWKSSVPL